MEASQIFPIHQLLSMLKLPTLMCRKEVSGDYIWGIYNHLYKLTLLAYKLVLV